MVTERIYRNDVYERSNFADVIDVFEKDGCDVIATSASVFFPEGGGQACDIGTVRLGDKLYAVTETYDQSLEDDVYHVTDAPSGSFAVGDRVELKLDWNRRFTNMQRHLGEHMLSGCFYSLYGGVNRGFHMGDDYITIDIDLDGRMLTQEEIEHAGRIVNSAIWEDLPVTVNYFDDYEDSRVMPVRKDVPHDGMVSVVTVWGNDGEPFDCIACCGTHPSSTGQVGIISIYKCEANKGMNRIYFDCGSKAYDKLTHDQRLLSEIANRCSSGTDDLLHKLDVRDEKEAHLKEQLSTVTQFAKASYLNEKKPELADALADCKLADFRTSLFDVNDLLKLGFELAEDLPAGKILVLVDENSCTALLYGGENVNCGEIVKSSALSFGGKGGGKADNARAVFGNMKDVHAWLEQLRMS